MLPKNELIDTPAIMGGEVAHAADLPAVERAVSYIVKGYKLRAQMSPPEHIDYAVSGVRCPLCMRWILRLHADAPMTTSEQTGASWHLGPFILTFFHSIDEGDSCRLECKIGDLPHADVRTMLEALHASEAERRRTEALAAPALDDLRDPQKLTK